MTRTVRIDPHVHSEASYDGHDPVELILEQAREVGLDAVVVTDHDVVSESLRAAELAPEYGLVGIPGVEVSTAHGHLLALGVEEMPPHRAPLEETVAWVQERGGVAIVPHPFQRTRHGVSKRHVSRAAPDALEVYNSWLFTGYKNYRARRYARQRGFPGVAGSDAHVSPLVGRAFTEIGLPDDADDVDAETILDAFRAAANGRPTQVRVQGRRTPIPVSARHYSVGAARKSAYYAKRGAKTGGYYAKVGALASLRAVSSVLPL